MCAEDVSSFQEEVGEVIALRDPRSFIRAAPRVLGGPHWRPIMGWKINGDGAN